MTSFSSSRRLAAARCWLTLAALAFGTSTLPAADAPNQPCAVAGAGACVIDLHGPRAPKISTNCISEPWSRYVRFIAPDKLVDSNRDGWFEAAVELVLDPAQDCGCVQLSVWFENPTRDWLLHVGDSPTNNGLGGDGGTTFHEAEMHIHRRTLSVFTASRGLGVPGVDQMLIHDLPSLGGKRARLGVCDQSLEFELAGAMVGNEPLHFKLQTPSAGTLYSLSSRAESLAGDGMKKKDKGVYAGFNRVIYLNPRDPRIGAGVKRVEISFSP